MIIAVTGANGLIARELIPFLESCGHTIIRISSSLKSDSKFLFSYQELASNLINIKVDVFIHLASLNSRLNQGDINKEVELTESALSSLVSLQCSRLIFFSTSKVYGDNTSSNIAFTELSLLTPECSYGRAKSKCESLIADRSLSTDLHSIIFRLPPVLNKSHKSNLGRLLGYSRSRIPTFSLPEGETNQRSFISLSNIQLVIKKLLEDPNLFHQSEIYNLADTSAISLNALLRAHSNRVVHNAPKMISQFIFKIPFLKGMLLRLYGSFVIDNFKLQSEMNVKLESTETLLYKLHNLR